MLDLEKLVPMGEGEPGYKGEWLKYSPKNPKNINLHLSYKSCCVQISHNEIFLSSMKYGYIYNTDSQQFTGQYNYAQDDEFYDGFYLHKNPSGQSQEKVLYGFGTKGVQKFDLVLKKWQLDNKINPGEQEEESREQTRQAYTREQDSDDSF